VLTTSGTYLWSFVTHIFHNGHPNVVNHLGKRYFSLKNICVFTKLRSLKSKTIQINEATEKGNPVQLLKWSSLNECQTIISKVSFYVLDLDIFLSQCKFNIRYLRQRSRFLFLSVLSTFQFGWQYSGSAYDKWNISVVICDTDIP
jgi:hypothetical protein